MRGIRHIASIAQSQQRVPVPDLELLRRSGWDVEERDEHGRTALHYAADCGDLAAIRWLTAAGADPNARDLLGWTPLHCAAEMEFVVATQDGEMPRAFPVCRLLVRLGARLDVRSTEGESPRDVLDDWPEALAAFDRSTGGA